MGWAGNDASSLQAEAFPAPLQRGMPAFVQPEVAFLFLSLKNMTRIYENNSVVFKFCEA